ncbi:uncharacterized protein FIBRA_07715 [Fibroporia radiculosa]|uniref:Uncharacterized protein n=1 Tax=Fibroporia radiculosa TaxID=599839 RepID=J4H4S4_9APHY|nr:uncharacterized protein FIBRA_07715 [Fibroporia radiculosa]CCM05494.1 predicted protein [Fibroporia radiculosa]
MVRVCSSIEGSVAPESTFPRELSVLVNDRSAAMPTHMFGVYSRENPPAGEKRRLTIYPQHAIVWAAHCASLPTLPASNPQPPASPTDRLTLPVVPLRLPDPESFPLLSTYLYTHRLELLLQNLLPAPPPAANADAEVLMGYARMLARTFTGHALYEHLMKLQGLWKNSTSLGIFEPGLWAMIDLVWEILVNALSICHENPHADTIPPPMPAKTFPCSYAMETDPAPMPTPAPVPVPSSPLRAQL